MSSLVTLLQRIEAEAQLGNMGVDQAVYEEAGRRVTEPVLLGSGSVSAQVGIFGRDPGRTEIELNEPFIGKGGQLVRAGLYRAACGGELPDLATSVAVGSQVFWANTVPYKPIGNKAWSVKVKRRFVPFIRELLVEHWQGHELITLGNVAFDWFRLAAPELKTQLREFWSSEERYSSSLEICLQGKSIRLHPLPHPSPLNAKWYPQFPALLDARLAQLKWTGT